MTRYSGAEFEWSMHPNQFVAEQLDGLPPGRALDLAAGEGRNSVWLAEQGWSVTAVDFSRVGLEKGRKLSAAHGVADRQVDWVVADLSEYEPARAAFDLVLIAYLQVGAGLRGQVLAGAAAALVPGGTLLVVGHDLTNLTEGVGGPHEPGGAVHPRGDHRRVAGTAHPAGRTGSPDRRTGRRAGDRHRHPGPGGAPGWLAARAPVTCWARRGSWSQDLRPRATTAEVEDAGGEDAGGDDAGGDDAGRRGRRGRGRGRGRRRRRGRGRRGRRRATTRAGMTPGARTPAACPSWRTRSFPRTTG